MRAVALLALAAGVVACTSGEDAAPAPSGSTCTHDTGRRGPRCTVDDGAGPVLQSALEAAGLTLDTFGSSDADFEESGAGTVLADPMRLSWFPALRAHPARAACFEGTAVWPLDQAMRGKHPVSDAIHRAAALLDRAASVPTVTAGTFAAEIDALCTGAASPCGAPSGTMPADVGAALAPLVHALGMGIDARHATDTPGIDPAFWTNDAGYLLFGFNVDPAVLARPAQFEALVGQKRIGLYAAAAAIARAAESIDWAPFRGRTRVRYDLATAAGAIQLRGGENDTYATDQDVLLRVDLGGDDVYRDSAGANRSASNAVSVVIDVAGNDHYGYDVVASPYDRDGLLPADAAGRYQGSSDDDCRATGACYGPLSLSVASRQGGARNGIAMLLDLAGDDEYRSLRASQGYAQFGVGVLFDGGGDDHYLAEAVSQGAAQFGIGLLIDVGCGNDEHRSITESQGFGYVGGAGFLLDDGGDDVYFCDHGDPARGGIRVYGSPQTTVTGNSSFCQGAGFGMRYDPIGLYLSGGIGILRDDSGDDRYDASVFAQGTGYWQGTGILSDGGGADRYQATWYIQGAAAHYAVGILVDDGPGDDVFDADMPPANMSLGSGHDFSAGVLIDEAGDDTYHVTSLAVGSSNCNGSGLFVDNGGNDHYVITGDYNMGMGNVSTECVDTRPTARSMGIFVDAGGTDVYEAEASTFPRPANDQAWRYVRSSHPGERGGGADGNGESGVHPGSTR
jgi:hypothetical protein